jgi:hypothetical protein
MSEGQEGGVSNKSEPEALYNVVIQHEEQQEKFGVTKKAKWFPPHQYSK